MKYKTTRKAIVSGTPESRLVSVGYCGIASLLRNHDPIAYTCGVYGWNFNVYEVYGLTICTGYRNMPGRTANGCAEYDAKARAIWEEYSTPWENRVERVETLLKEFCEQA